MEIKKIKLSDYRTNCYILSNEEGQIVIDPATNEIDSYITNLKAILITHYHVDHIGGLNNLKEKYNVEVYDYQKLGKNNVSGFEFETILVKGHHETCVMFKFDNMLFTGDFLFKETIGRTDLPTGNYEEMMESIKKIKEYDDHVVYPGHGAETTLDYEKVNNPYFS